MTTPSSKGHVLHLTASTQSGSTFAGQLDLLRETCLYRSDSETWHTFIGSLDVGGLRKLNVLFEAARLGAHVQVAVEPAPVNHKGPVLSEIGADLAAALAKQADSGRPLGHVVS